MSPTSPEPGEPSDVAIVGIGLRFPGAHGPQEFWSNLQRGIESRTEFGDEELAARGVPRPLLADPAYVKSGFVLPGIELFDAEFFGFSPKDAAILDPQHRQFLECAWEALEDAGHVPATFPGPIGVFGGCGMQSYFAFHLLASAALVESTGLFLLRHTGNDKDFLTTRVSYCLDLKGPSVNVQTACSTSLVAVHLACQSLQAGECDLALAGGVTLELPHAQGYLPRPGEILSPDGHCRPFDAAAAGTVFGSGVGLVVLRPLAAALREGDRIYAVVKGSAVNNDGARKVSYLAPSVDGQAAVVAEALAAAGVEASSLAYVETHGSGTALGEPIEVAALRQAFGRPAPRARASCGLGSVKANIGHLDTAAGVAGLIKMALALHHGELPPLPNFVRPNPDLALDGSPFHVEARGRPWPRGPQARRAGVTALGVGGTNAHVVLEEAPVRTPGTEATRAWQVLCLSARTRPALEARARGLATHLARPASEPLSDVAFTLLAGRRAFAQRRVLCVRDGVEAAALLAAEDPRRVFTHTAPASPGTVAFLLPGGGAQHARMGLGLYQSEPLFRLEIERAVELLRSRTGLDLGPLWGTHGSGAALDLERPSVQLPALFVLEYALARFWITLGVRPDALLGHSLGETTAACLAGVFALEDALALVHLRGELLERLPPGGMLSVPLGAEELQPWLGRELDLAAVNAPGLSVVSGPSAALEDLARRLSAHGLVARRIPITSAAHSRLVEPALPQFLAFLRTLTLHPPRIPFTSNSSGTWITAEQAVRPEYWSEQLRGTVRFADCVRTLLADPARVYLEVGPGKALCALVRQQPEAAGARGLIASLRHADETLPDQAHFLTAFGRLWACGVPLDTEFLWRGERRLRVALPTYPFQHQRHWIEPDRPAAAPAPTSAPQQVELLTQGLHQPVWRARARAPEAHAALPPVWLLFLDAAGLGERLAANLRARGARVFLVREGDDNRSLGADEFALAPERGRDGYRDLVRELLRTGAIPQRIVHLWLLTPDEGFRPGSNFFHRNQERGFYSLLFLAQALDEEGPGRPLHLSLVTNGMAALEGEALLHPDKATALGPCRVIPREFPGFTCASIDLSLAVAGARATRRPVRAARLVELLAELEPEVLAPPRWAEVAFRNGLRHELELEPLALAPLAPTGPTPLRARGVYLITGGLGALGLALAAHLARKVQARLVLVGRTPLPERGEWNAWLAGHAPDEPLARRLAAVLALEDAGSEVLLASADVTDVQAMRALLDATQRRFGALHGVFHAAGVLRDGPILGKAPHDVEDVLAPKVHGTRVLDRLLADRELDFLVLFSSLSALVGPAGQVDYVAASAFLDAYAQSARPRDGRHVVAVDWGPWSELGMAAELARAATPAPTPSTTRAPPPPSPGLVLGPATDWCLDEHRTRAGQALLPGAAYLGLVRAAWLATGRGPAFELRDLLCLQPLHVPDGATVALRSEFQPTLAGLRWRLTSRAGPQVDAATEPTHAEARLAPAPPEPVASVDLAALRARLRLLRTATAGEALECVQHERMRFGPRWRSLREVHVGADEVLVRLALAPEFVDDLATQPLHPALLDLALSAGLELFEGRSERVPGLWVPLSFRRVRVHAAPGARPLGWVRRRASTQGGSEVRQFDVTVLDEDGRVCLELDDLVLRNVGEMLALADAAAPAQPARTTSARASPAHTALQRNVALGIRASEGLEALMRILGAPGARQVVVSSLALDGLRRQAESLAAPLAERPAEPDESELEPEFPSSPDGIEAVLAGFWRELLGVRRVGLRDSFFDLGGHSLIAVRLFSRIQRAFQVEFPISILFEAPTIERCAEAIRRARPKPTGDAGPGPLVPAPRPAYLVPMHPGGGGDGPPFFLVAGMFGNVLNLRHLAQLLGDERRFYGLQARGLHGLEAPHETFEEMARAYLLELRAVQPSGPYLLGGFSGGGITAFEMARQLLAVGEEVALLVLLDTTPPRAPEPDFGERARILWQLVRRRGPVAVGSWARDRLRWELSRLEWRRSERDEPRPDGFRSQAIGAAFRRALARYVVRPYPGTVTLFRPPLEIAHVLGEGRVTNARRELVFHDNGWGAHVARLVVHEVPGDHDSMVLEPNVRVLAARLQEALRSSFPPPLQRPRSTRNDAALATHP